MMDFIFNEMFLWLAIAYAVGTAFGYWAGKRKHLEDVVESVIDSLIDDGYIKTRGQGTNLQILKHWEK